MPVEADAGQVGAARGKLAVVIAPIAIGLADQMLIATALPLIGADFESPERVALISSSYLAAAAISVAVYGRLGDLHGAARMLRVALCLYISGSLLCLVSGGVGSLAAGRAVQGLGGGGLIALSHSVVAQRVTTEAYRRMQSRFSLIGFGATSLAPPAAGMLMSATGWRVLFLACAVVAMLALLALRNQGDEPMVDAGTQSLDWTGIGWLSLSVGLFTVAAETVERLDLVAPLALSGALLAGLILAIRSASHPGSLFPTALFIAPALWTTNLMIAFHGAAFGAVLVVTPLLLRHEFGLSVARIGTLLALLGVLFSIGSVLAGMIMARSGWIARLSSIALTAVAACLLLLGLAPNAVSLSVILLLLGTAMFFIGGIFPVAQVVVRTSAAREHIGTAASSIQLSRSLGSALGAGGCGAVLMLAGTAGRIDPLHTVAGDGFRSFALGYLLAGICAGVAAVWAWSVPLRSA